MYLLVVGRIVVVKVFFKPGDFLPGAGGLLGAVQRAAREGVGLEFAPVDPGGYPEDWELLTRKVVGATYRTSTEGKEIQVLMTVVDTGGEGGRAQQGKGAAAEGTSARSAPPRVVPSGAVAEAVALFTTPPASISAWLSR